MTHPWHRSEVDMIRRDTVLHLDLSPQWGELPVVLRYVLLGTGTTPAAYPPPR